MLGERLSSATLIASAFLPLCHCFRAEQWSNKTEAKRLGGGGGSLALANLIQDGEENCCCPLSLSSSVAKEEEVGGGQG